MKLYQLMLLQIFLYLFQVQDSGCLHLKISCETALALTPKIDWEKKSAEKKKQKTARQAPVFLRSEPNLQAPEVRERPTQQLRSSPVTTQGCTIEVLESICHFADEGLRKKRCNLNPLLSSHKIKDAVWGGQIIQSLRAVWQVIFSKICRVRKWCSCKVSLRKRGNGMLTGYSTLCPVLLNDKMAGSKRCLRRFKGCF